MTTILEQQLRNIKSNILYIDEECYYLDKRIDWKNKTINIIKKVFGKTEIFRTINPDLECLENGISIIVDNIDFNHIDLSDPDAKAFIDLDDILTKLISFFIFQKKNENKNVFISFDPCFYWKKPNIVKKITITKYSFFNVYENNNFPKYYIHDVLHPDQSECKESMKPISYDLDTNNNFLCLFYSDKKITINSEFFYIFYNFKNSKIYYDLSFITKLPDDIVNIIKSFLDGPFNQLEKMFYSDSNGLTNFYRCFSKWI